jgi:UDP-3-O-[3-hydroxymyristoyl] N-acetylglucosamine deacetylase
MMARLAGGKNWMDGLPESLRPLAAVTCQHTLKSAISCVGTGLHSGRRVNMTLKPSGPGTGIVFRRTDLGVDIRAAHDHVVDTRLCTQLCLPGRPDARVGTVEHVMAALAAAGVDNVVVELDGPEVPVFDGSSAPFLFLIDCAGLLDQAAPRQTIEILQPVRVEAEGGAFAELRPGTVGLDMALSIDFPAAAIGRQALSLSLTERSFRAELAHSRTFTMLAEIEAMQAAGLARGGSLANAVVVDGARVVNPEGLRRRDEFVRHKLLDAVGDLALAGAPLQGRFLAHKTGHALNNKLLRALFASARNWRHATPDQLGSYAYISQAA